VAAERRRRVHLDVRDPTLRLALGFAAERAGWTQVRVAAEDIPCVSDRIGPRPDGRPLAVLVISPSPAAARLALDAFTDGGVRCVLPADDAGGLPLALELARRDLGLVPAAVVASARSFPPLGERLQRTLELVLRGWSNPRIAQAVHPSEATTKRDVAELLRRFDAPNRVALAATALRLGVRIDGRKGA
jgi:DNA-binding CsgD family transcriptional regulator